MVKGLIFDYGGTLDTGGRHWGKVLWQAYVESGSGVSEGDFREAYVYAERTLGRTPVIQPDYTFYRTLDAKLAIELGWLEASGRIGRSGRGLDSLRRAMLDRLYDEVKQQTERSRYTLERLKPRFPMALVSNFYGNIGVVLDEFGLGGLFDHVVESAVVGIRKPDPRIFTLGVEALGLEPDEVVVVGDSYGNDIVPAKRAGCHAVWLKGEGWTDETHDETLPDAVITDLSQLGLNVLHDNMSK